MGVLCYSSSVFSKIVYVKNNATGSNNGTSWSNAYTQMYSAISGASSGDTLWVAEGVYLPNGTSTINQPLNFDKSLFILGGFPSNGTPSLTARDFRINKTIVSGKLSSSVTASSLITYDIWQDSVNVVFDGLIFENAVCTSTSAISVYSSKGQSLFRNCIFRKLRSSSNGTLMLNTYRCKFMNCYFIDNYCGQASFIRMEKGSEILNSVFYNNLISEDFIILAKDTNALINNSFVRNKQGSTKGLIRQDTNVTAIIQNNLFYDNGYYSDWYFSNGPEIKFNHTAKANFANNITFNQDYKGSNHYRKLPFFLNELKVFGNDSIPFNQDDGFKILKPCSEGIDIGNNTVVTSSNDILGNQRILNGTVDIGAYEAAASSSPKTIYVNANATGANNGTSWTNAYLKFQDAFLECGDTIKIAEGTYKFVLDSNRVIMNLRNRLKILGGYPSSGSPGNSLRNPAMYKSIISGYIDSITKKRNERLFLGENLDSTFYLDGLIFEKFGAPEYWHNWEGTFNIVTIPGIIKLKNCNNISLNNLEFNNNSDYIFFNNCSNIKLRNSKFFHNGGTGSVYIIKSKNIELKGVSFKDTSVVYKGDVVTSSQAVIIDSSSFVIDGCSFENKVFITNITTDNGACIETMRGSLGKIKNCKFTSNFANIGSAISASSSIIEIDSTVILKCSNSINAVNSTINTNSLVIVMFLISNY